MYKVARESKKKYDDATVKSIKLMPPENSITNLEVDYRKMQGMIFGEKIPWVPRTTNEHTYQVLQRRKVW